MTYRRQSMLPTTGHSVKSRKTTCVPKGWKELFLYTGDPPVQVNQEELGKNLVKMPIRKVRI